MRSIGALALAALSTSFACQDRPAARSGPPTASALASGPAPSSAPPPPSGSLSLPSSPPRFSAALREGSAAPPEAAAPASPAPRAWPPAAPGVRTPWCGDRVTALDAATCYVLPDAPPRELMIYLHGIIPPEQASPKKTNLEAVVANAARRAGAAAIIPRGEQGLAPRGRERWWGWPTGDATYRRRGPALVALLRDARARFEAFVGITFERVYVAGSSSGAYFATELALRGSLPADGFAAISGGAGRDTGSLGALAKAPFYIGYSSQDASAGSARALGALLRGAGWPVRVEAHAVPHGAHEVYLDEAFAFWREHAPRR